MRATTLLNRLLNIKHTRVIAFCFDSDGVLVDVGLTTRVGICASCVRRVRKVHDCRERLWRHLDLAGMKVHLRYAIRMISDNYFCRLATITFAGFSAVRTA